MKKRFLCIYYPYLVVIFLLTMVFSQDLYGRERFFVQIAPNSFFLGSAPIQKIDSPIVSPLNFSGFSYYSYPYRYYTPYHPLSYEEGYEGGSYRYKVKPAGWVSVIVSPSSTDAFVLIDGHPVKIVNREASPEDIGFLVGKHDLHVERIGYKPFSAEFSIETGKVTHLKIDLIKEQ